MAMVVIQGLGGGGSGKPEEEKEVALSMQGGDQVVAPASGKTLSRVTIKKPTSMIPDNIREGVVIGGVTGTMQGGGVAMPTLNAVTITRSGAVFTIANPSTNGNFVTGYKIYGNGNLNEEITTTTYELKRFPAGRVTVLVKAKGNNFNDGRDSNTFACTIYTISNVLSRLTTSNPDEHIADGQDFVATLKPEAGLYLPEFIDVTMGGSSVAFEYNSYTGVVKVEKVAGDVVLTASAYEQPKLRTPEIVLDDHTLAIGSLRFARQFDLYVDDAVVKTYTEYADWSVENVPGASYGFAVNTTGYYESQNKKIGGSYALCKIGISLSSARTIVLKCISSGESTYDFGILSKLDTELSLSASIDGADKVQKNFSGQSSTNAVPVSYDVPAGDHFIYAKYRKDGSGDSGNDSLQFTVEL